MGLVYTYYQVSNNSVQGKMSYTLEWWSLSCLALNMHIELSLYYRIMCIIFVCICVPVFFFQNAAVQLACEMHIVWTGI